MRFFFVILTTLLSSNLMSQSNYGYKIPHPLPETKYSFLYEVPSFPDKEDSTLEKVEYYRLINKKDSIPEKTVFYKNGQVNKIILYKRNTDSVKAIFDYDYEHLDHSLAYIKYTIFDKSDTIYAFRSIFISSYNKPYLVLEYDSTHSKMLAMQFINSEFDNNNNLVNQDAILFRDFSGFTTEGQTDFGEEWTQIKESGIDSTAEYIYDKNQNIIRINYPKIEGHVTMSWKTFKYDKLNRLIKETRAFDMPYFSSKTEKLTSLQTITSLYTYNKLGNISLIRNISEGETHRLETSERYYYHNLSY